MENPESAASLATLQGELRAKIFIGQTLLDRLSNNSLKKVQGLPKLEKKVRQEVKFLEKFEADENISKLKKEHINCSNLAHLSSIIDQIFLVESPTAVIHPFNLVTGDKARKKVVVDVVADKGQSWIKVVARNPKALDLNSQGGSQFGQKSIIDQVKEFVQCSAQNELMFKQPVVKFVFANGVTSSLHKKVCKRGAVAIGEIVNIDDDEDDDDDEDVEESSGEGSEVSDESETEELETETSEAIDSTKVNLDITAMIAYVSALTNGRNWFSYKEKILSQQADWERHRPVKPYLESIFRDKQLVCCASAMNDFITIINTLGGAGERERGTELIKRMTVVPDSTTRKTESLTLSGKIKDRSLAIFATGDFLRVLTVTANTGFIRAAAGQGVNFAVITHESRALTEDKEKFAVQLQPEFSPS